MEATIHRLRGTFLTRAQVRKLETILAKVEALQNETGAGMGSRLQNAKSELMRLLREASN
jgi:hypothetical protein